MGCHRQTSLTLPASIVTVSASRVTRVYETAYTELPWQLQLLRNYRPRKLELRPVTRWSSHDQSKTTVVTCASLHKLIIFNFHPVVLLLNTAELHIPHAKFPFSSTQCLLFSLSYSPICWDCKLNFSFDLDPETQTATLMGKHSFSRGEEEWRVPSPEAATSPRKVLKLQQVEA